MVKTVQTPRDGLCNVVQVDMPDHMRELAVQVTEEAYKIRPEPKYEVKAKLIGETFDRKYGTAWQCCVGKNFGSRVIHEVGKFIQIQLENDVGDIETVLLYKCGAGDFNLMREHALKIIGPIDTEKKE